uniref:Protein kinase domain-containing protein n=1 Tax=Anguilla anguilla TaxID=7936 RepID=A0A0E9RVJ4_ANGAN
MSCKLMIRFHTFWSLLFSKSLKRGLLVLDLGPQNIAVKMKMVKMRTDMLSSEAVTLFLL